MSVKPKILSSNNNQSPQISNTNMKKFDFSSNITIIQIWSGVCGVDQLPKLSRSILLLLIEPSSCIFPRFSTEKSHRHYWSWRIYRLWWQRHCHRPVRSILPRSTPLLLHWYRCCCHRHWHSRLRHEQCSIITGNDPPKWLGYSIRSATWYSDRASDFTAVIAPLHPPFLPSMILPL